MKDSGVICIVSGKEEIMEPNQILSKVHFINVSERLNESHSVTKVSNRTKNLLLDKK